MPISSDDAYGVSCSFNCVNGDGGGSGCLAGGGGEAGNGRIDVDAAVAVECEEAKAWAKAFAKAAGVLDAIEREANDATIGVAGMDVGVGAEIAVVAANAPDTGVAATGSGRVEDRTGVVGKWGLAGRSVEEEVEVEEEEEEEEVEEEEEGGGTVASTRVAGDGADWRF